jgi:hypothetical protein
VTIGHVDFEVKHSKNEVIHHAERDVTSKSASLMQRYEVARSIYSCIDDKLILHHKQQLSIAIHNRQAELLTMKPLHIWRSEV